MSRLSLAQQIAELEVTAPKEFDAEENTGNAPEDDAETTLAAREHYVDVGPSSLRRAQDKISDPKYSGVKVSRDQIEASASEEEFEEDAGQDSDEQMNTKMLDTDKEEIQSDEDSGSERAPGNMAQENRVDDQPEPSNDITAALRQTRNADRNKGKAITRQLDIWDSLLEARIRLQKSVVAVNRLPTGVNGHEEPQQKMLMEAALLADELFELQENLLRANESITLPPRKRRRVSSEDGVTEIENYLCDSTKDTAALEYAYHPYLLQTLAKWSSKIQAVAPSLLAPSNRNTFSKNWQNLKSVVQLIEETLTDHDKLLARTQTWRGKDARPGREREENLLDTQLFDDTDFYQHLLRDVIEGQGRGDDWMALQRQKKAKKKVDTKASKGRKIRYEVHEKLQNFMVPVPVVGSWHDEQIDELFSSLLGKGLENALSSESIIPDSLDSGFRVF